MKEFSTKNIYDTYFDQLIKSYRLPLKVLFIYLISKVNFIVDYYLPSLLHVLPLEPNWSNHQIHWKQIIGRPTPTSKSCKPLIAEDDYQLTADCCLQVHYMSHNWYRPIFGFSVYLTEVVNPLKLSNWYTSWRSFCTKKWITYTLSSSSRDIECRRKQILFF